MNAFPLLSFIIKTIYFRNPQISNTRTLTRSCGIVFQFCCSIAIDPQRSLIFRVCGCLNRG
ncbi:hypothetical protein Hdeb2414_s0476g00901721 [Helianthus debilis subsp. tardiflorus]